MRSPNYDDKYNLRLYSSDKVELNALRTELGLSPRDLLMELMDYYKQGHKEMHEHRKFELTMQSRVENAQGPKNSPLRKITFYGSALFVNTEGYWQRLTEEIAKNLKDRFGLIMRVDELERYWFGQRINVYKHDEKACFLIQEILEVHIIEEDLELEEIASGKVRLHPLHVTRCGLVKDYDELCLKFGQFAGTTCLRDLAPILAKDIGSNYLLMDELF